MKCEYCYHSDQENLPFRKKLMPEAIARTILYQSASLGVNSLKFNWRGEATIHPKFSALTELAKKLSHGSIFVDRLTNSNFKFNTDREDIFYGLSNQTKVKVSYDSFRKEVFEKQRAGGDHAKTTRNIHKFYNWPKRKTQIVIQAVRTKLNKDEDLAYLIKKNWPDAGISIRDMVEGRVEKNLDEFTDKKRDLSQRQSCLQAHVRLIFNHEGRAFPCCPDIREELCLGDIKLQSLKDIFNSHMAKKLRLDLKNKEAFKMSPCASCSSFETYKGYKPAWNS